jgi:hypothetical protein
MQEADEGDCDTRIKRGCVGMEAMGGGRCVGNCRRERACYVSVCDRIRENGKLV